MKIVTKILLGFCIVLLLLVTQNVFVYEKVSSIGSEIEEIAEYQIPISDTLIKVEKDVLEEKILFYEILLANNEHTPIETLRDQLKIIEKDTDKNCDKILRLVDDAIKHSHESEVKHNYNNIVNIVDQVCKEQQKFEKLINILETDIKNGNSVIHHKHEAQHLIEKMAKEIAKSEHLLLKLLKSSTTNAESDEHSLISMLIIIFITNVT